MKRSIKRSLAVGGVALSLCSTVLIGVQAATTIMNNGTTTAVAKADQVAQVLILLRFIRPCMMLKMLIL